MRETARTLKSAQHWQQYRILRNECSKDIRTDRSDYFSRKYNTLEEGNKISRELTTY